MSYTKRHNQNKIVQPTHENNILVKKCLLQNKHLKAQPIH